MYCAVYAAAAMAAAAAAVGTAKSRAKIVVNLDFPGIRIEESIIIDSSGRRCRGCCWCGCWCGC